MLLAPGGKTNGKWDVLLAPGGKTNGKWDVLLGPGGKTNGKWDVLLGPGGNTNGNGAYWLVGQRALKWRKRYWRGAGARPMDVVGGAGWWWQR